MIFAIMVSKSFVEKQKQQQQMVQQNQGISSKWSAPFFIII